MPRDIQGHSLFVHSRKIKLRRDYRFLIETRLDQIPSVQTDDGAAAPEEIALGFTGESERWQELRRQIIHSHDQARREDEAPRLEGVMPARKLMQLMHGRPDRDVNLFAREVQGLT